MSGLPNRNLKKKELLMNKKKRQLKLIGSKIIFNKMMMMGINKEL